MVEGAFGLGSGRVRVPTGDDDAALVQEVDEIERAFELGSEGHLGNRAGIEQPLEESAIGIASSRLRVSSQALGERNGPSRWAPSIRGPIGSDGNRRRALTRSVSGAVMKVGWNAVTPVARSASPAWR